MDLKRHGRLPLEQVHKWLMDTLIVELTVKGRQMLLLLQEPKLVQQRKRLTATRNDMQTALRALSNIRRMTGRLQRHLPSRFADVRVCARTLIAPICDARGCCNSQHST